MQWIQRLCITGLVLLTTMACSEEEPYMMEEYIDIEMIPYFYTFEEEGRERGVEVRFDESGITALFDRIDGSIAGQCTSNELGLREIKVDQTYWRRASDLERELVIFHELGHCYLGRAHLDDSDAGGRCTSLMNSGLGNCRSAYSSSTREDYLDELFIQ